jgi:hypothetical protein
VTGDTSEHYGVKDVTNAKRPFVVSRTGVVDEFAPGPVPGPHPGVAFNACAVPVQSLHQMALAKIAATFQDFS